MKGLWFCFYYYYFFTYQGKKKVKNQPSQKGKPFLSCFVVPVPSCSVWRQESKRWDHIQILLGKNMCWQLLCEAIIFLLLKEEQLQAILLSRDSLGFSAVMMGIVYLLNAQNKFFSLPASLSTGHRAICPTYWGTFGLIVKITDLITSHKLYSKALTAYSEASCSWPLLWACSVLFLWHLVSMFTILTNAGKIWSHTFMSLFWSYLLF